MNHRRPPSLSRGGPGRAGVGMAFFSRPHPLPTCPSKEGASFERSTRRLPRSLRGRKLDFPLRPCLLFSACFASTRLGFFAVPVGLKPLRPPSSPPPARTQSHCRSRCPSRYWSRARALPPPPPELCTPSSRPAP